MHGPALTRNLPVNEKFKLNRYHAVFMSTFVGVSVMHNYFTRRPISSSLLKHAALAVAGHYAGTEATKFVEERKRMRVLILEDYIRRHPEDFPVTESKKYGDILLPWVPSR